MRRRSTRKRRMEEKRFIVFRKLHHFCWPDQEPSSLAFLPTLGCDGGYCRQFSEGRHGSIQGRIDCRKFAFNDFLHACLIFAPRNTFPRKFTMLVPVSNDSSQTIPSRMKHGLTNRMFNRKAFRQTQEHFEPIGPIGTNAAANCIVHFRGPRQMSPRVNHHPHQRYIIGPPKHAGRDVKYI